MTFNCAGLARSIYCLLVFLRCVRDENPLGGEIWSVTCPTTERSELRDDASMSSCGSVARSCWSGTLGSVVMIQGLTGLASVQVEPILATSQREGCRFVARLCEEWASGVNRFEKPREVFFGVFVGSNLVGIGGLNRQTKGTGRLR